MSQALPYKIAVLCYLYDGEGRVLLLHRKQMPNAGMYSPIGGKLHLDEGEAPHACALREIREETGIALESDEVRLCGIVTECAYEGQTHWMLFLFEVMRPVRHDELQWTEFKEGRLDWVAVEKVERIAIPETDRAVMWPLVQQHRGGFFMAHIDCTAAPMKWSLHESEGAQSPQVMPKSGEAAPWRVQ
jgi:8-oxo-dGTP diphosphatase